MRPKTKNMQSIDRAASQKKQKPFHCRFPTFTQEDKRRHQKIHDRKIEMNGSIK